jgi:hypothetical protein
LEKTNCGQGNSILPKPSQLLPKVHRRIFTNDETTFRSPQKKTSFEWKENQQRAFEDLKEKLLSAHDLKFPDFTKLFEIHTDLNNFTFERVLM